MLFSLIRQVLIILFKIMWKKIQNLVFQTIYSNLIFNNFFMYFKFPRMIHGHINKIFNDKINDFCFCL